MRKSAALPAGGPAILAVMSPSQVIRAMPRQQWRAPISMVVAAEGLAVGRKTGISKREYSTLLSSDVITVDARLTAAGHEFIPTHKIAGPMRLIFGSAAEVEFLAQTFAAGGIDPMSATMAMVEAVAQNDKAATLRAEQDVDKLKPADVLDSLGRFGQLIAKGVRPEQKDLMRAELAAASGDDVVHAAVIDIGTALLVDASPNAAASALAAHAKALGSAGGEALTAVLGEIIWATGRIVRRLDIKLHFKSADVGSVGVQGH
jgi:hypothetical protein